MLDNYQLLFEEKITAMLAEVPKGVANPATELFLKQFYNKMPIADLKKIDTNLARSIALSAYDFLQTRTPNEPKIRVFNLPAPTGNSARGLTIIEIINNDMAFLVDSISAALVQQGFTILETIHPILRLKRDKSGKLEQLSEDANTPDSYEESFIHLQISPLPANISTEQLIEKIQFTLKNVYACVNDWQALMKKAAQVRQEIAAIQHGFDQAEINEVADFMGWLIDKNFVFLGYIEYDFFDKNGKESLSIVENSASGIFNVDGNGLKQRGLAALPVELQRFAVEPNLIEITKALVKSPVHRMVPMDYIGIKRFDKDGKVIGESRFLGLFTSVVYYQGADAIPFIRRKIARTLERSGYELASHSGKSLRAILEFFPRDELFQISEDDLFDISIGVMSLEAKPEIKVFARKDRYERFVSVFVYMPRDRFSTFVREQIIKLLEEAYEGSISDFYTQLTDSPLARLQVILRTTPNQIANPDLELLSDKITDLVHFWDDSLREELTKKQGDAQTEELMRIFQNAFPKTYVNFYDAVTAAQDIENILETIDSKQPSVRLEAGIGNNFHLKISTTEQNTALSDMLPILENLGCRVLDVNPFTITPNNCPQVVLRDFTLALRTGEKLDIAACAENFQIALKKIWGKQVENDGYNTLILRAGLTWRQAMLLRAYGKYIKQVGLPYNEAYVAAALEAHPQIAYLLVKLFETRFSISENAQRTELEKTILGEINEALARVSNLAEDRILRQFSATIMASLRSNYFQTDADNQPKAYLSIKLDSQKVPELPLPRPLYEIFVYSIRTEGIHLRGGTVARGGLRWSDRNEDFRTEVLGLMKAQMVKNSVIVPVGSKGGFVLKQATNSREALMEEGIFCYKQYLAGLLDITDNIISGKIVPPAQVVRHDNDDPYLVVAADKGTASFSDIANSVSIEYGFWLGDAFASGGSAGYDHKKMAITARGAWVSVARHFSEMGIDIQTQDFTVAGIGDMSGDVFGNGMLLSRHIRLVAAFNHRHIFFDPNPEAEKSFIERERLFNLARSGWDDYDQTLISAGGGIFDRSAKTIELSPEIQAILGTGEKTLSPDQCINLILKAPVDLLWNGGIGTYVKAADESHESVGDRTNNNLRINADELRCKVIGEGGNLGLTQKGRIAYAKNAGRINTDFIDNSAGVDCSDHEVNIKIALSASESSGTLTRENRDILLASMTDDVAHLVLRDNVLQSQAITITQHQGYDLLESQAQLMRALEQEHLLHRGIEFLPTDKEIAVRASEHASLTRPELAVLLSYTKISVYNNLLASELPDAPYYEQELLDYFPHAMRETYGKEIRGHRLRREIIATIITNNLVNYAGLTFFHSALAETGRLGCDIARAYTLARDVFGLKDLWAGVEALDGKVDVSVQVEMFKEISKFLERAAFWFLHNCPQPLDISQVMQNYAGGIAEYNQNFREMITDGIGRSFSNKENSLISNGAPKELAANIAKLDLLAAALDIVQVAKEANLSVQIVGKIYYRIGKMLQLGWMRRACAAIHAEDHWAHQAIKALANELYDEQRRLTQTAINHITHDKDYDTIASRWQKANEQPVERFRKLVGELKAVSGHDISMLVVALRHLRGIGG